MKRQQPEQMDAREMQATILDSIKVMHQFMSDMKCRMDRLEGNMDKVQDTVGGVLNQITHSPSTASQCSESISQMSPLRRIDEPDLFLRLSSEVESMWYTDRPFPPFTVDVVDAQGNIYEEADEWDINIHLVDGYGRHSDEKLGQNERSRRVTTEKGRVTVAGLRFYAVSSKNGGHFNLEFQVRSPRDVADRIPTVKSNDITILSCRLFHNPKAPLEKLQPSDSLSMMPGIGRLYAQRFSAVGIDTIAKLASISLDTMSAAEQQLFLESLRKDKGTMTKAKLEEYISQACHVVNRTNTSEPAAKRQCTMNPSIQVPASSMMPSALVNASVALPVSAAPANLAIPSVVMPTSVDTNVAVPSITVERSTTPPPPQSAPPPQDSDLVEADIDRFSLSSSLRNSSGGSRQSTELNFEEMLGNDDLMTHNRERRVSSVSKYFDMSVLGGSDSMVSIQNEVPSSVLGMEISAN